MKEHTITVRIDDETNRVINALSQMLAKTKKDILKEAVCHYKKIMFFKQVDKEFGELRDNQERWEEEQQERKDWESTIGDGLEQ